MSNIYYNISIDRSKFKFTDDEISSYNDLYERYNKIVNKLDSICPENSPKLFKIHLIRIANIQRIVTSFRSKRIIAKLQIQISDVERQKVLSFRKLLLKRKNNPLKHIAVEVPEININIIGKATLIEEKNNSFSKYDCFNEFYNCIDEINSHSIELESEMYLQHRGEELKKEESKIIYEFKNNDRDTDYTTEDDIISAIQSGNGDRYGY